VRLLCKFLHEFAGVEMHVPATCDDLRVVGMVMMIKMNENIVVVELR
jgi:hypothetical protein